MIKNKIGNAPFNATFPFSAQASVLTTPTTAGSEVTISLIENGAVSGIIYRGDLTRVNGINLKGSDGLKVEIDGGGSVFISYLEENIDYKAGVSFGSDEFVTDGAVGEFELKEAVTDSALLEVYFNGFFTDEYTLSADGRKIIFNEIPFANAKVVARYRILQ